MQPKTIRRRALRLAKRLAAAVLLSAPFIVYSQDRFPSKPVRMVVPFAAGSATDISARILGEGLREALGVPLVVENRVGANGQLAVNAVKALPADGYSLLFAGVGIMVMQPLMDPKLTGAAGIGNPLAEFRPVAFTTTYDLVFTAGPGGPKSMKELVEKVRTPGEFVTHTAISLGSNVDLSQLYFVSLVSGKATAVPYKSPSLAQPDVMSGRVTFAADAMTPTLVTLIKEGKLRGLAAVSKIRLPALPDVPSMAEAGLPAMTEVGWDTWFAIFVLKQTPESASGRINEAVRKVLSNPSILAQLEKASIRVAHPMTLAESEVEMKRRLEDARRVLQRVGMLAPGK